ncbi:Sybindin-like family-domain-containing protein [Aspergillus spinulosporus]
MEDHYHYPGYYHYSVQDHLPTAQEVEAQYYSHHVANATAVPMSDAVMEYVPITAEATVKDAQFPSFGPMRYPPPPSASDMGNWCPLSPFDESVRSVSPQTDCQSNCMSTLSYDDSISYTSSFENSPSPSYPEISTTLYKQESISHPESTHATSDQNYMLLQVFNQPNENSRAFTSTAECEREALLPSRRPMTGDRVQKHSSRARRKSAAKPSRAEAATAKQTPKKTTDRRFECCFARYGCESTFPSKNEWKRHVNSQHIQIGFYRCDIGRCSLNNRSPSPTRLRTPTSSSSQTPPTALTLLINDFNRKDLFIQHQRRMHSPWSTNPSAPKSSRKASSASQSEKDSFEESLKAVVKRCWHQLREPPTLSHCGFCDMEFRGANAWKERMEHVARHYEKRDPGPEKEDLPLRKWAEDNGIREFQPGLRKLSTNDYLVLAGTFHGVHAITRSITPKLPNPLPPTSSIPLSSGAGTSSPSPSPSTPIPSTSNHAHTSTLSTTTLTPSPSVNPATTCPNPHLPVTGLETLETDKFRLTCFQTLTGTKFLLFTDPLMDNVDVVMKGIYELYADYVMKNPFYQIEMPVRCERFDRGLGGFLRGRG